MGTYDKRQLSINNESSESVHLAKSYAVALIKNSRIENFLLFLKSVKKRPMSSSAVLYAYNKYNYVIIFSKKK